MFLISGYWEQLEGIQHSPPGLRVRGEVGLALLGSSTDPMTRKKRDITRTIGKILQGFIYGMDG